MGVGVSGCGSVSFIFYRGRELFEGVLFIFVRFLILCLDFDLKCE